MGSLVWDGMDIQERKKLHGVPMADHHRLRSMMACHGMPTKKEWTIWKLGDE
jgi:hypothetical protein